LRPLSVLTSRWLISCPEDIANVTRIQEAMLEACMLTTASILVDYHKLSSEI
jgi:hypothetical protein